MTAANDLELLRQRVARLEAERSSRPATAPLPDRNVVVAAPNVFTVGLCVACTAGTWAACGVASTGLLGIVTEATADVGSLVTLFGLVARSGTVGTVYYPDAAGALATTPASHQAWPVAVQVTPTQMLVLGILPRFAAEEIGYCENSTPATAWMLTEPA